VSNEINNKVNYKINELVSEIVATDAITKDGKTTSIIQYVRDTFERNIGWGSPNKKIEELGDKFGNELKQRYDTAFATRIVMRLNEQGMLKEDVVKKLIDTKSS
jgi:hypothetical protein